jgi:hypothetical protein
MATLGSIPNRLLLSAEDIAISASCSAVGLGLTAQSPNTETLSGRHIKNTDETSDVPGLVLMNCKAGLIVCKVVLTAPDTIPSASPLYTIIVPK